MGQQYWNDTCTKEPQGPVALKEASGKSPIEVFGQDEDWDITLPKIPEEGKVDKEGKEDEGAKAKRDCLIQVESSKAKKEKKTTKDKKEEPLRRTLNNDRKEKNEAGEEKGKEEKDEDERA